MSMEKNMGFENDWKFELKKSLRGRKVIQCKNVVVKLLK